MGVLLLCVGGEGVGKRGPCVVCLWSWPGKGTFRDREGATGALIYFILVEKHHLHLFILTQDY